MQLPKIISYSYWELKQYFDRFDLVVVGSGITGLSTAISFKQRNKKANILVLERGLVPCGASSKSAGFACFGSASELLDDLKKTPEHVVWETVKMRWDGLNMLRKRLGDKSIDYKPYGGYELFDDAKVHNQCIESQTYLNKTMHECLGIKKCYKDVHSKKIGFKNMKGLFLNEFEGQLDSGLMMQNLVLLAQKNEIIILNNIHVTAINDLKANVEIVSESGVFKAKKVVVATNGFATELLKIKDVKPARAQVLITKPIKNLKLKGSFHYQQGYYYFRNINNRVLFGGGRNLDFKGETTTSLTLNKTIQKKLDVLLKDLILPNTPFEVEHRWAGIMGVGGEKKPIIKKVSENVLAAVRMGGMGIAIGSLVGETAAKEIE